MSVHEPPATEAPVQGCPYCGAPLRAGQEWCLNCGAAVTTHVAGARGWRTPIAIVGVVLLLATIGLVVAFLEISDDADRTVAQGPTPTPTAAAVPGVVTPVPSIAPTVTPPAIPTPSPSPLPTSTAAISPTPFPQVTPGTGSTGGAPGSSPTPFPTTPSGSTGTVSSWPSGKTAYTVVLLSGKSEASARKKAQEFAAGGTPAGVLNSSQYSSLRPGYWVVFSGQYETKEAATTAAEGLRAKAPQAYARLVKP